MSDAAFSQSRSTTLRSAMVAIVWVFAAEYGPHLSAQEHDKSREPELKKAAIDQHGDPLPAGCIARFGTVRFRHPGPIDSLVYSPNSQVLVSGGSGKVCFWEAKSGKEIGAFADSKNVPLPVDGPIGEALMAVVVSPNGKFLASARGGKVRVWDIDKAKEIAAFDVRRSDSAGYYSCAALAFADGGATLIHAGNLGTAQGWNLKTGTERFHYALPVTMDIISAVALSQDGKLLAYAQRWGDADSNGGPVRLLDAASGKVLHSLRDHKQAVFMLRFSPDGAVLATASNTERPKLWNTATGKTLRTLTGDEKDQFDPRCLAFSPDGKFMVTGEIGYRLPDFTWSGILRLWDTGTGKSIPAFQSKLVARDGLTFSPDGKSLAVADGNAVRLLNAESGKEIAPSTDSPTSRIHSVDWLKGDERFAFSSLNGLWLGDIATGKSHNKLWKAKNVHDHLSSSAVSPDGKFIALEQGRNIKLFDAASLKPLRTIAAADTTVGRPEFSRDGRVVAARCNGFFGSWAAAWDRDSGKKLVTIAPAFLGPPTKCKGVACEVAVSRDGKMIATGYEGGYDADSGVQVWDVATGNLLLDLSIDKSWIGGMAFSANSKAIAAVVSERISWKGKNGSERVVHAEGGLIVWDVPAVKRRYRVPSIAQGPLTFSPDGKLLAVSGDSAAILLLDAATGKTQHRLLGHRGQVSAIAFSANSERLLSGGHDATVLIWDIMPLGSTK